MLCHVVRKVHEDVKDWVGNACKCKGRPGWKWLRE